MSVLPSGMLLPQRRPSRELVLYSLIYTFALVLQFSNDSRYLAAQWVERNVPVNATIEVGERGPVISEDKYNIINSLRDPRDCGFCKDQA